jgi:hypothetical protein
MDPYGTKVKVPYTANGLGIYVALSTMDKYWYPDITREEAGQLLKRCIDEVKLRKYTMLSSLDGPRRWLGKTDGNIVVVRSSRSRISILFQCRRN